MREITFRGKRKDNCEWVYGDLYHDWSRLYTKPDIKIANNMGKFTVIPETVGQYTGLTDKSGKKIFDGDILESKYCDDAEPDGFGISHEIVKWIKVGFFAVEKDRKPDPLILFDTDTSLIVGNIHDNPDLLEK